MHMKKAARKLIRAAFFHPAGFDLLCAEVRQPGVMGLVSGCGDGS
jgi:hypothetical protein